MEYKIREYMDQLFENAPHTQRAYELKIELTQNLIEKYYALVGEGKSPEDAYNLTVMSIGDVRELFAQLEDDEQGNPVPPPVYYPQHPQQDFRQRRALVRTLAMMLYILCVVPPILFDAMFGNFGNEVLGPICMFIMIALATGLLVYDHYTHPRKAQPVPGSVVQDFQQWQRHKAKKKHYVAAFNGAFWPLVLAVYFLLSFGTGKWAVTWIIFLIAPAVDIIANTVLGALMDQNQGK